MNSLNFYSPSGSPAAGSVITESPVAELINIVQLVAPDVASNSGANHLGFFGAGGPEGIPFAVIVDQYQDKTFITNQSGANLGAHPFGIQASGELINHKYVSSSSANVSGLGEVSLTNVTALSGTLLCRFIPTDIVRTQNAIMYTVNLNANSGVNDLTAVPTNLKIQGYEVSKDATWTQTAGVGAVDNRLLLTDHSIANTIHDFFIGLSCSPEQAGERNDFGFVFQVEFL